MIFLTTLSYRLVHYFDFEKSQHVCTIVFCASAAVLSVVSPFSRYVHLLGTDTGMFCALSSFSRSTSLVVYTFSRLFDLSLDENRSVEPYTRFCAPSTNLSWHHSLLSSPRKILAAHSTRKTWNTYRTRLNSGPMGLTRARDRLVRVD